MTPAANGSYSIPSARSLSVWLSDEDIEYVGSYAAAQGITRNRAFAQIIEEHRKREEMRARRRAGAQ